MCVLFAQFKARRFSTVRGLTDLCHFPDKDALSNAKDDDHDASRFELVVRTSKKQPCDAAKSCSLRRVSSSAARCSTQRPCCESESEKVSQSARSRRTAYAYSKSKQFLPFEVKVCENSKNLEIGVQRSESLEETKGGPSLSTFRPSSERSQRVSETVEKKRDLCDLWTPL